MREQTWVFQTWSGPPEGGQGWGTGPGAGDEGKHTRPPAAGVPGERLGRRGRAHPCRPGERSATEKGNLQAEAARNVVQV